MIYIGIDPGNKGGIAIIREDKSIFKYLPLKYNILIELYDDLNNKNYGNYKVYIEQQGVRKNNSKKSAFGTGRNFGRVIGITEVFTNNIVFVPPANWKKEIGVTKDKQTSIDMAYKLFHNIDLKFNNRFENDHDGVAEALLIAEYGRRQNEYGNR